MATHQLPIDFVCPTRQDVRADASPPGSGRTPTEATLALLMAAAGWTNRIISGFAPPTVSGGLTQNLTGGEAVLGGQHVKMTVSSSITYAASKDQVAYLRLQRNIADEVVGVQLEVVDEPAGDVDPTTPPAMPYLPLWRVSTGASTVTGVDDYRSYSKLAYGRANRATGRTVRGGSGGWYASQFSTHGLRINFAEAWPASPSFALAWSSALVMPSSITLATDKVDFDFAAAPGTVQFLILG